jgi:hypothetical protein
MNINITDFAANSLFNVEKKNKTTFRKEHRITEFPFDLCFRIIADKSEIFQGPGIYWITFKAELIYIGSYSSALPNLISDRWVKHIQTFTNRGYRLGFNAITKKELIPNELKCFFDRDKYRYSDTGTVTSLERLSFASRNFDEFKLSNGNEIIKNFHFYYCQLDSAKLAKKIESGLIEILRPICNSLPLSNSGFSNTLIQEIESRIINSLKSKV